MADCLCSPFGSKSLTKSSPFLSHYTAPKPFFVIPLVSFHHSIHTKRTRQRRPSLHFACLCASSADFDVISTHEHSDGSFLFRFGDPSEVVKNDQLKEIHLVGEEKGNEVEEDFSDVDIIDSGHTREVAVKSIKCEETSEDSSEVVDHTNQVVENESRRVSEIESSSGETSSSSSVGVQVLVSGLGLDIRDSSELTEQVGDVIHGRGNIELKESVASDVEDFVHVDGSIEVNGSSESVTQVENVVIREECLVENDGYGNESPATLSPCPPDHVSGPEDQGASAEIVQPLSEKNIELISLELNRVVEVNRDSDNIKEQLIRNDVDQRDAWLSLSPSEHGSVPEYDESSAEITENQELVSAEVDPVIEVPADDFGKENSQEKNEVAQIFNDVEAGTQNNTIGDSSKREIIDLLSLSSPLEAEPALHEEGNGKSMEVGTQDDIVEGSSAREVIGILPLFPPLEAEPVLGEEGDAQVVEVKIQDDIRGGSCEIEVIETLSLPQSVEAGTQNIVSSGGEVIGTLPLSPPSEGGSSERKAIETLQFSPSLEAEPVLGEEGDVRNVEVKTQNDILVGSCEIEVIGTLPLSPPSEAEQLLAEGNGKVVEAGTQNDVMGFNSETEVIETYPPSPPLDAEPFQPVPDNEPELEQTEISNKSFRSGTATMINTSEIMEAEVDREIAGIDELVDSSGSEKTVSKQLIPGLQSEKIRLEKLFLSSGTASLPHPEKALAGGEDACFTCQNWFGVADGVSEWSLDGVDHGKFAHELMEISCEIVLVCGDTPVTSPEVLNLAVVRAQCPGSSTVLISHFDGKDLHVANIGDSGVIILRNGAVCQRSSPMFHEYNFPVLVHREGNSSMLVERYKFCLDEGDIVVAATDGLFDNLYEQEIVSTVSKSLEADKNPKEIAEILAMRAHEVGSSTCTRSPFSDAAQAAGYTGCTGGKLDDVVVVVSLVKKGFDSHAS